MGMFDYVEFEMKCPQCKNCIKEFQTKDFDCSMDTYTVKDVPLNGEFYSYCDKCEISVRFSKPSAWRLLNNAIHKYEIGGGDAKAFLKRVKEIVSLNEKKVEVKG